MQLVGDRALLVTSFVLALLGWVLMVPPDGWGVAGLPPMGFVQFGLSFSLVTIAFPFGRGVCLSMVGKLLGNQPQGGWMGIMFALGAIARIAGPFWAVTGYSHFGSLAVFGSTAALFGASLATCRVLWGALVAPEASAAASDFEPSHVSPRLSQRFSHFAEATHLESESPFIYGAAASPHITAVDAEPSGSFLYGGVPEFNLTRAQGVST